MSSKTVQIKVFGRYQVLDEVGRGAMGIVYRGFDPVIGRTVALKTIVFDSNDRQAQDLRARLYREACAAGTLNHPNIVTVYDVVEYGGTTAVAMEFIEGRDLAGIIAERAPLPFDEAAGIFEQLCSALDFSSARGIVHRDIKPANILLTPDGRVKVTDFGVARMALSNLTQAGTVVGSPNYMSPEQIRGRALDGRSDLFSATVVLYEMLTKERPFGGNEVATTLYRIVNEAPTPPSHFNPAVGDALTGVFARALAKEPDQRFATGAEIATEVRRAMGGSVMASATASSVTMAGRAEVPGRSTPVSGGTKVPASPTPVAAGIETVAVPMRAAGGVMTVAVPFQASAVAEPPASMPGTSPAASADIPAKRPRESVGPAGIRVTIPMLVGGGAVILIVLVAAGWLAFGRRPAPGSAREQPTAATGGAPSTPVPGTQSSAPPSPMSVAVPSSSAPVGAGETLGAARQALPASVPTEAPSATGAVATGRTRGAAPTPSGVARTTPSAVVYDITQVDVQPKVVSNPAPEYPPDARRRKLEDVVVLSVLVSETGRPLEIKVLRKAQKARAFDAAAVTAVRSWVFKPARRQGKPVRCWYNVGVPFQLRR